MVLEKSLFRDQKQVMNRCLMSNILSFYQAAYAKIHALQVILQNIKISN